MSTNYPTFEQWVTYSFEHGPTDHASIWRNPTPNCDIEAAEAREAQICSIPFHVMTEYAIKLFSSPSSLLDRYSPKQIGEAIWFIFSIDSGFISDFRSPQVPLDLQIQLTKSINTLYTDLFDHVCNDYRKSKDACSINSGSVIDSAVFMIWDMDCFECPLYNAHRFPTPFIDALFEVLETALFKCETATCKRSGIHGLGHAHNYFKERVQSTIDRYLAFDDQPTHLIEYAQHARMGNIE